MAPAELEDHLLTHPFVSDCAVIPVQDKVSGELPKAYIIKSKNTAGKSDAQISREIRKYTEDHKARYKWLKGGIEFVDLIPKSPSGKILRRLLRDREKSKAAKDDRQGKL